MGQPVSKTGTTAPFENYQVYTGQAAAMAAGAAANRGPPAGMFINNDFASPPQVGYAGPVHPTRQDFYRAQRGGRMPPQRPQPRGGFNYPGGDGMDDMDFFQDDDNMSGLSGMGRRQQYEFDPMSVDPRFTPQQGGGMARDMISDIRQQTQQRVNPARAQNYRSRPPPQQDPRITRTRTVVDEPFGYVPPTQSNQGYSYQQPAQQMAPAQQQQGVTPQQATLYYDPQTGAIQNPTQQQAPPAQQYFGYVQPTQAQTYQQAAPAGGYQQPMGYGFPNAMPQGYMYGMPQQQQPIVIPAQIFSK